MKTRLDVHERFWSKVAIGQPNDCWEWQGAISSGYGLFRNGYRIVRAHRFAYEATGVKAVNELDHLCRNPRCVNPAHLEDVPHRVNMGRGAHAMKTHCPRGHEYTPSNIYWGRHGQRNCRLCNHANSAKWRAAKRLAASVA